MRRFVAIAVLAGCLPAFSWGPEGHNLVARLAEARLTSEARARVAAILGPNTSLASISSWPDQIRRARPETAPWHYVDIPIDKPHLDMARDFRKALRDPATPPEQRREALMFLVHFIGDMHQPLHCSDNKDKGGNGVQTQFFGKPMNLHSVWDGGLLGRMGAEDQLFAAFSKDLTPGRTKKLSQGTVSDWAEQSHKSSQKIVYGKLAKVAAGTPVPISEAYEKAADPLIKEQLEKAGARLAQMLNAALQ